MDDKTEITKSAIQHVVRELMDRVLIRVTQTDPFLPEDHKSKKPIYAALVPDEIFKGSHFERRFVTPFGGLWEKLAVVSAESAGHTAIKGHRVEGLIPEERLRRIQQVLSELEFRQQGAGARRRPDWAQELAFILEGGGELLPSSVECDVYIENNDKSLCMAFEIKAPLPNSDQTKVSKEKMLKLYAMEPCQITSAYYALPYNPYGSNRADYAWSFPARWFNMVEDESVLIGKEFWDKIGGEGTYTAFISAINEIGPGYRERIYRDYLGIDIGDTGSSLLS